MRLWVPSVGDEGGSSSKCSRRRVRDRRSSGGGRSTGCRCLLQSLKALIAGVLYPEKRCGIVVGHDVVTGPFRQNRAVTRS